MQVADQEVEQFGGGRVRPVQVLEDQQDRRQFGQVGEAGEQCRKESGLAERARRSGRGWRLVDPPDRAAEPREVEAEAADGRPEDTGRRLVVELADEVPEDRPRTGP